MPIRGGAVAFGERRGCSLPTTWRKFDLFLSPSRTHTGSAWQLRAYVLFASAFAVLFILSCCSTFSFTIYCILLVAGDFAERGFGNQNISRLFVVDSFLIFTRF